MRYPTKPNFAFSIVLLATIWGLVLNGFFLYVPFLVRTELSGSLELIVSLSWMLLCIFAVLVGRNYLAITTSKKLKYFMSSMILALNLIGVIFQVFFLDSWSWIWLSAAASLAIVLLNNRLILNFSNNKLNLMSAWLGAAPLIGSVAISLLFYLTPLREFYPFAIALVSTGIGFFSLLQLETQKVADDFMQQQKVDSVGLLQYGFLLGFAVAIVNTFVYLRLGEIYHAAPTEVAQTGSLLIAIASFAGVLASLSAGLGWLGKVPRLLLARVAPALVAIGILVLLLATDIAWAGLAGVLVAIGFGLVNGLELSLVQIASSGLEERIQLFGTYLAMSTAPYVIAGLSGLALIRESLGTWPLFLIAFVAAVSSIAFLRRSRQTN